MERILPNSFVDYAQKDGQSCDYGHYTAAELQGKIVPDQHVHEHATCFNIRGKGLVVISSCGHVGIVNSVRQAQEVSGVQKVHAIVGGFHLGPAPEDYLKQVVARDQEARAGRSHPDALQRPELPAGGARSDARQRHQHLDRQPPGLQRIAGRRTAGMAARGSVIALALLGVLGAAGQPLAQRSDRSAAELMDAVMWNREPIGGPFALIDQNGKRRTDADFRGKVLLVYFGFTYCPDVCPTDLQEIGLAVDRLGPAGDAVQPIFITVDPPRDTPEHLKEYVAMFHARFVGLTGDAAAIDAAARAYRVYLRQGRARKVRLHRGPLRLHLSDGTARRISRLFSARHARGHSCRHAEAACRRPLADIGLPLAVSNCRSPLPLSHQLI